MANKPDIKIAQSLQAVAKDLDLALRVVAGERVNFSLLVWTEGRTQYVSNCERESVARALEETLLRWRQGMPDVPAQEVN